MNAIIRPARLDDSETIVNLIHELAVYEKLGDQVVASAEAIRQHLFGTRPYAEALIAEVDGQSVGFALYFHNFSTFRCKPGIYLEDLFVKPEYRGGGIGKALLQTLAKIAIERGCGRLEWAVLEWNEPAIGFYRSLGGRMMDDWRAFRVDDEALIRLAAADDRR